MVKVLKGIICCWLINEFLQVALFDLPPVADFLVSHLSSFYGAVIIGFYVLTNRYPESSLLLIPVAQLCYNFVFKGEADLWDVGFSFFGIILSFLLMKYKWNLYHH